MRAVIDRFEGNLAVLLFGERGLAVTLPRELLPPGAGEGDILRVSLEKDPEATREQREKTAGLLKKLRDKSS